MLSAAASTSPSSSAAPIPPCAPSTAPCTISNASSPNAAPKPRPQAQNPPPRYPRKPKPISPNSNWLNKKLGSFLHFALLRNPPATAPIPCRWSLPVTGSRLTRRPSRPPSQRLGFVPRSLYPPRVSNRLPYLIPITHVHKQRGVHVSTMRSGDLSPFGTPFPNDRANRQYREGVN